jgi:hypothetical protein
MSEKFEQGEYQLGCYMVQFARFTPRGWDGGGPWLRAIVTNLRLLVLSENSEPRYSPISITCADIVKIWNVNLGRRNGVILLLKKRRLLYFLVDWGQGSKLVQDVKEMLAPPVQPRIAPRLAEKPRVN